MTDTTTPRTEPPLEAELNAAIAIQPSDILMNLIAALLAPLFLCASGGDIHFARTAAIETVNAYRARDRVDLIAVAQIIAFGLAALGSLSLSMADDLSLSMTLRLRGNANALNRSAEQNRRALRENRADAATPSQPERTDGRETVSAFTPADAQYEAEVLASVAETRKRLAQTPIRLPDAEPAPQPAPITTRSPPAAVAPPVISERQLQVRWAAAMADVAEEFTAGIPDLPPAERRMASMRAAALNSSAKTLLSGAVPPRLRPGALDPTLGPNPA